MTHVALVTGAAGNLGMQIARRLKESGRFRAVLGTDISKSFNVPSHVDAPVWDTYVGGIDLTDRGAVARLFREAQKHRSESGDLVVVHVAAWPGPAKEPPVEVLKGRASPIDNGIGLETISPAQLLIDNVASTYNVFEAAVGSDAKRVVFSSSAFATGWSHDPTAFVPRALPIVDSEEAQAVANGAAEENNWSCPHETYGLSKVVGESIAAMFARNTRGRTSFVSLRFTNIVKRHLFAELPWRAPNHPTSPEGSLTLPMWAYTHEDDVIDAHVNAADCERLPLPLRIPPPPSRPARCGIRLCGRPPGPTTVQSPGT